MNMWNIRLVSRPNGGLEIYGIRRGFLFYKYLDLNSLAHWRSVRERVLFDCFSSDLSRVQRFYHNLMQKDNVIQ